MRPAGRVLLLPCIVTAVMLVGVAGCHASRPGTAAGGVVEGSAGLTWAEVQALPLVAIDGSEATLRAWEGRVLLIVNTASRCGFTRQYAGLQTLFERYADAGLTVLAFPSNDFGGQEPGSAEEIAAFCEGTFGVTFPLFDKVAAAGASPHPLFRWLTQDANPELRGPIRWNFNKFLVDRQGRLVARFGSRVEPLSEELVQAVEAALAQ